MGWREDLNPVVLEATAPLNLEAVTDFAVIIERSGSIAAMPALPRVDLFNRQEELNQILAKAADDSRVICRRERPTGSKLPVNNCATLAERRKTREGGKQYLREIIPSEARGIGPK